MSLETCRNSLIYDLEFWFSLLSSRHLEVNQVPQDLDVQWR